MATTTAPFQPGLAAAGAGGELATAAGSTGETTSNGGALTVSGPLTPVKSFLNQPEIKKYIPMVLIALAIFTVLSIAVLSVLPLPVFAQGSGKMKIGMIGSGRVGGAIGGSWVKAGHEVMFSSIDLEADKKLAASLGGGAKAGTTREAAAFDEFVSDPAKPVPSQVDIAIGMNVVTGSGDPFAGTKIRGLAEAGGMRLEGDGVFYLRNEAGQKISSLDNHEPMPFVPEQMKTLTTSGVTFLLDVPCVSEGIDAFENMLATARNFAETLDGVLVDDNRRPLTDEAIGKIRHQLTGILAKMDAGQIAAGGARALRLFS